MKLKDKILSWFNVIKCNRCEEYKLGGADYVFTCYGNCTDLEPPDDTFCCKECAEDINPEYVWRAPYKLK